MRELFYIIGFSAVDGGGVERVAFRFAQGCSMPDVYVTVRAAAVPQMLTRLRSGNDRELFRVFSAAAQKELADRLERLWREDDPAAYAEWRERELRARCKSCAHYPVHGSFPTACRGCLHCSKWQPYAERRGA